MAHDDVNYQLLRQLNKEPIASQRHLAARLGVSVGKINYLLKALIDKGWIKANNFRRSDNKWAYSYLMTAKGATAMLRLTKDFLLRKEIEYYALQLEIESLRTEIGETAKQTPSSQTDDNRTQ